MVTLEPEVIHREETFELPVAMPPIFGRCPACGKPLRPRCKVTGEPKAPRAGTGFESRAKCDRCGTIICYVGGGEWRVLTEDDPDTDDGGGDSPE